MTITLNIYNEQLFDTILSLLNRFKNRDLDIVIDNTKIATKEDKAKTKFSEFSGLWKDRDITQKSLREEAWR